MSDEIGRLVAQLHAIEDEIERRLDEHRQEFGYSLRRRKAVFEAAVRAEHRRVRIGVLAFLRSAELRNILVAPVIYAMIVPLGLLDLGMCVYQHICFRAWGMSRVIRSQHIVLDRHRLGYLNAIQKLNCLYCGYANGVISFAREIIGRTEQYWCPIKHAIRVRQPHQRYRNFLEYGDAEGYRTKLDDFRRGVR
jgi:hypothetical protein